MAMKNSGWRGNLLPPLFALAAILGSSMAGSAQEFDPPQEFTALEPAASREPVISATASSPTGTQQQAVEAVPGSPELLEAAGKVKLAAFVMFGRGLDSIDVGTTTGGEAVKVSGGGGAGFEVAMGYGMTQRWELDVSLGTQKSTEMPAVKNANISFSRRFLRTTLKYLVPLRERIRLKFGAGVSVYNGGELDIDTSQAPGGGHDRIKYFRTAGGHLVGEFEGLIGKGLTFIAGLRVYKVTYAASSWEHNGVEYNYKSLPSDVRYLDGGGADLFIGLAQYF